METLDHEIVCELQTQSTFTVDSVLKMELFIYCNQIKTEWNSWLWQGSPRSVCVILAVIGRKHNSTSNHGIRINVNKEQMCCQ